MYVILKNTSEPTSTVMIKVTVRNTGPKNSMRVSLLYERHKIMEPTTVAAKLWTAIISID